MERKTDSAGAKISSSEKISCKKNEKKIKGFGKRRGI